MDCATILKHIPQFEVLLCTLCNEPHCVPLNGVHQHFYDFHREILNKQQRTVLKKYAYTFEDDLVDPVKVLVPPIEARPVEGLHKTHGYECLECLKLLPGLTTMKEHCRSHGWASSKVPPLIDRIEPQGGDRPSPERARHEAIHHPIPLDPFHLQSGLPIRTSMEQSSDSHI